MKTRNGNGQKVKSRRRGVRSDEIADLRSDSEVVGILEKIDQLDGVIAAYSTAIEAAKEERRIEFNALLKKTNGAKKGIANGWLIRFVACSVPERVVDAYEYWYFKVKRVPVFTRNDVPSKTLKVVS